MRPRKKVLLWSALEFNMHAAKFVLDTRGMHTRVTFTVEDFIAQLAEFRPDGVALWYDGSGYADSMRACENAAYAADVRVLLISRCKTTPEQGLAHMIVAGPHPQMIDILEALRTLCAHKRGPKRTVSASQERFRQAGRTLAAASARLA